jgi:hypothetical protein
MAEPLFILADIEISDAALRRWLKTAPRSAATFDDWPDALFRSDSGLFNVPATAQSSVADELVAYCVSSFGAGHGYLYCNYDEQAKRLRFAVYFQYGDEAGVMETAIFLCALLRGIADIYTAKKSSFIRLFDTDADDLLCIEISKKASRILPSPENAPLPPAWFSKWISQDNLGDPDQLTAALFPPLARALKKQVSLGALRASPQAPYRYDCFFWTDGDCVYAWPDNKPVQNADPKTFRRVTPGSMDSAFYADARQIWYHDGYGNLVPVQSLEPGVSMQGWRPFGSDGEPLLRCGDTVWSVADINYPNPGNFVDDASRPRRSATKGNVKSVLRVIELQSGIPMWKKLGSCEYLRPTQVDGASFTHIKDSLFEDDKSVYVETKQGLVHMEGAIPGMTTYLGELSCNNGQIFYYGYKIQCQVDAASLRHIGRDFYADNSHVYVLEVVSDGYISRRDLNILQDAESASFRILSTSISTDERHVWLDGKLIPDLMPDAVRVMGSFFWTDGIRVYYDGKLIPDADPGKFEVLVDSDYARQGTTVYFRASPIPGADAASFIADGSSNAHDRYRSYEFGESFEYK